MSATTSTPRRQNRRRRRKRKHRQQQPSRVVQTAGHYLLNDDNDDEKKHHPPPLINDEYVFDAVTQKYFKRDADNDESVPFTSNTPHQHHHHHHQQQQRRQKNVLRLLHQRSTRTTSSGGVLMKARLLESPSRSLRTVYEWHESYGGAQKVTMTAASCCVQSMHCVRLYSRKTQLLEFSTASMTSQFSDAYRTATSSLMVVCSLGSHVTGGSLNVRNIERPESAVYLLTEGSVFCSANIDSSFSVGKTRGGEWLVLRPTGDLECIRRIVSRSDIQKQCFLTPNVLVSGARDGGLICCDQRTPSNHGSQFMARLSSSPCWLSTLPGCAYQLVCASVDGGLVNVDLRQRHQICTRFTKPIPNIWFPSNGCIYQNDMILMPNFDGAVHGYDRHGTRILHRPMTDGVRTVASAPGGGGGGGGGYMDDEVMCGFEANPVVKLWSLS